MSDVTFLKKQEKELKRLQLGIEQVNSGVSFWSNDNKLNLCQQVFEGLY